MEIINTLTNWEYFNNLVALLLAAVAGYLIGYEREAHNKPAGSKDAILICLGSALFTILSYRMCGAFDPTRIAAQIVTGVGFLGAGVILHQQGKFEITKGKGFNYTIVIGLTTAAIIWILAAIGMAFGAGMFQLGILSTILIIILPRLASLRKRNRTDTKGEE